MQKRYQRFLTGLIIFIGCASLIGCSLSPVKNTPTQTYVLDPVMPALNSKPGRLTLLVEIPRASQAFNSNQMAYVNKPYQLGFFSYNQWADTPAQMLHPLLMQALQNTQRFRAVLNASNGINSDAVLNTRILRLQQNFLKRPSAIELQVVAQLINNNTHQMIAEQQFNITEPAPEDTPYGGVIAANKAAAQLLQQITQFCLDNTKYLSHK